jgi:hypothetical protein
VWLGVLYQVFELESCFRTGKLQCGESHRTLIEEAQRFGADIRTLVFPTVVGCAFLKIIFIFGVEYKNIEAEHVSR